MLALRRKSLASDDFDPYAEDDPYAEPSAGSSNFTVLPPAPKIIPPEEKVDRAGAWPYWGLPEQLAQGFTWGQAKRGAAKLLARQGRFENEQDALDALTRAETAYKNENPFSAPLETFAASALSGGPALKLVNEGVAAIPFLPGVVKRLLLGTSGYGRAGEALPGNAARVARVAGQATAGGFQGGVLNATQAPLYNESGEDNEDYVERGIKTGALTGALAGPTLNALANWAKGPVISPDRAQLGETFRQNEIPLRGAQVLRPGTYSPEQSEAFDRAVARSFGEELLGNEGLSPDVAQRFLDRNRADFGRAAAGGGVVYSPNLHGEMNRISAAAAHPAYRGAGQDLIDEIGNLRRDFGITIDPITGRMRIPGGANINGQDYLRLTQRGSELDRIARQSAHGDIRDLAGQMREALDNALEASNPAQAELIQNARREYKNFRTVEPLLDTNSVGSIKPSRLETRVRNANRDFSAIGTPGSDLGPVARGANAFFTRPEVAGHSGLGATLREATSKLAKDTLAGVVSGGTAALVTHEPTQGLMAGAAVTGAMAAGQAAQAARRSYQQSQAYANKLIDRGLLARMAPNLSQSEFNRLISLLIPGATAQNGEQ